MDADNLAEDHEIGVAFDLYDLGHATFQRCRGVCHAGAIDLVALRRDDVSRREFVHIAGERFGGRVHCIAHRIFHNIHAENAGLADVGDAVLGVGAI